MCHYIHDSIHHGNYALLKKQNKKQQPTTIKQEQQMDNASEGN